jgi:hypothetical protein
VLPYTEIFKDPVVKVINFFQIPTQHRFLSSFSLQTLFSKFIVSYSFFLGFSARKKERRENLKRKDKKGFPEKKKRKKGVGKEKV